MPSRRPTRSPKPAAAKARGRKPPARRTKPADPVQAYGQALKRAGFAKRFPQLQLQALRLGKLLAIQQGAPDQEFPPGTCFLHANLPTSDSFCVRSLLEVDLDAATAIFAIWGDDVLEAGHVILPLEHLAWIGFPDKQVNVGVRFVGFSLPTTPKKPLLVKR